MEEKDMTKGYDSVKGQADNIANIEAFYDRNNRMSFILKKTEKITTAVYMVTDFMSESEPLRKELRTLSVLLLSKARLLSIRASEPDYMIVDDIKFSVESLNSFLGIAVTIGLISNMNGNILVNELSKVLNELTSIYKDNRVSVVTHPGYANIILDQKMFEISAEENAKISAPKPQEISKGQEIKNDVLYKKPDAEELKKESAFKNNTLGLKIARRNDVLNIVKVKGQVSIKDIVLMLKDVSEKTVQRELFSLVKEGVLKKEGEKRWSVYKLV